MATLAAPRFFEVSERAHPASGRRAKLPTLGASDVHAWLRIVVEEPFGILELAATEHEIKQIGISCRFDVQLHRVRPNAESACPVFGHDDELLIVAQGDGHRPESRHPGSLPVR